MQYPLLPLWLDFRTADVNRSGEFAEAQQSAPALSVTTQLFRASQTHNAMSSYHPHHPRSVVPPPRRSASSAVAQALRNANRPRSGGSLYSNPYSSLSSTYSPPSSSSSYLSSSPSSSYHPSSSSPSSSYHSSPSSSYTPSSVSSAYHSSPSSYKPSTSTSYHLSPSTYKSSYARSASSRHSPSRFSGMGSRSASTSSLSALSTKSEGSEGYIVRLEISFYVSLFVLFPLMIINVALPSTVCSTFSLIKV